MKQISSFFVYILSRGSQGKENDFIQKDRQLDFPGGAVVKNLPANAGDTGSSPGPGRSHMPWCNWACAPQLLSLSATTTEPAHLELVLHSKRSHCNEKPTHRNKE